MQIVLKYLQKRFSSGCRVSYKLSGARPFARYAVVRHDTGGAAWPHGPSGTTGHSPSGAAGWHKRGSWTWQNGATGLGHLA